MPLTAATAAREILTGLHDVMARRGSAQAKLDRVVDLIAEAMASEVCSIYLLRNNKLELFATRPFALYGRTEVASAFEAAGFQVTKERPQFFLPMAFYRLAGSAGLARAAERLARSVGLTGLLGSPVIARADRRVDPGGSRRG